MNDPNDQGMELAADDDEEDVGGMLGGKGNVNFGGQEVKRIGKEDDERTDAVKRLVDPRKPTKDEVDYHELFHLPYRNWCPLCVRAKGKELDHRKSLDEPRGLSEYSFDYAFPGDEFGYKLTILSGREKGYWYEFRYSGADKRSEWEVRVGQSSGIHGGGR